MTTTLTCQRCGGPMPDLPDDLARLMRSAGGVTLTHEVCPGEENKPLTGRLFQLRADVVEILADDDVEMMSFRVETRADNLDAAMRTLADRFGEKWMEAEKRAAIADSEPPD